MPQTDPMYVAFAQMVLGFVIQKTIRAQGRVPNAWSYVALGVGATACYVFATRGAVVEAVSVFQGGDLQAIGDVIRKSIFGVFNMYLGSRGAASSSSDVGIAPPTVSPK